MRGAATTILSGTRDELGGVDIAIVNVYERPERPGVQSGKLITPDGEQFIAVGDEVALGGARFRLEAIAPHASGAYTFRFTAIPAPAAPEASTPITPIAPATLARCLRERSAAVLDLLGLNVTSTLAWTLVSRDSYNTEWNGEQIGPITHMEWTAALPDASEAWVGLDLIRYNPDDLYRAEVSAYWKVGDRSVHLFGRAEGTDNITEVRGDQTVLSAISLT